MSRTLFEPQLAATFQIENLPAVIDDEAVVKVPPQKVRDVKLCVRDGSAFVIIRPVPALDRHYIADYRYRAIWVGWHRGQKGGYGSTPLEALQSLQAGKFLAKDSK